MIKYCRFVALGENKSLLFNFDVDSNFLRWLENILLLVP